MYGNIYDLSWKYGFLKKIPDIGSIHFEVTKEAIEYVKVNYPYYDAYSIVNRKDTTQISTEGWALSRGDNAINVACDVLTTWRAFEEGTDTHRLKNIYHTVGNFIPIPEGANYGGYKGRSENYEHKLTKIKEYFDQGESMISEKEIEDVEKRLKNGFTLGKYPMEFLEKNNLKALEDSVHLRYWIWTEWFKNGRGWQDYVDGNYLQDFVDEDYNPLVFDRHNDEKSIELIIKRGYRIDNKKAADKAVIEEIFNELDKS